VTSNPAHPIDEAHPPAGVPNLYKTESTLDDPWPPLAGFLKSQFGWWSLFYVALWVFGATQYKGIDLVIWVIVTTVLVMLFNFLSTQAFPIFEMRHARGLEAKTKESWLHLEAGETVIRDDLVVVSPAKNPGHERLGRLVLTNRRLSFLPAEFPWWYGIATALSSTGVMTNPLTKPRDIALADIATFHVWEPPFSAAPAAELKDGELVAFGLREEEGPWQTYAGKDEVAAHFTEVEAAWKAAI
jgi:hypothetical protein